jgi:hypothetical protein
MKLTDPQPALSATNGAQHFQTPGPGFGGVSELAISARRHSVSKPEHCSVIHFAFA